MSVSASIFSLRILYLLTLLYQAVSNGTVFSFYGHPPEVCNVRKPERLYAEMTKEMWAQHLGDDYKGNEAGTQGCVAAIKQ